MLENTENIIEGAEIIKKILNVKNIHIGIEANKPDAYKKFAGSDSFLKPVMLKVKYPQGAEKQLIDAVTGRRIPPGKLPMDVGVVVVNAGTVFAIYEAVVYGKPLIDRIVTVSGGGIKTPKNLKCKTGTIWSAIINYCGGISQETRRLIMGGPMMGVAQFTDDVPFIKGVSGILALTEHEVKFAEEEPCIRCGKCIRGCPMNLMPSEINRACDMVQPERLYKLNLSDCIECGTCSYICPANKKSFRRLENINYAQRSGRKKMSLQSDRKMFEVICCPHISRHEDIAHTMLDVVIALVPAIIFSFIFFRWQALYTIALTTAFCVAIEYLISKIFLKKNTVKDYSAVVTGILLAMNLPSSAPWWIMFAGAVFAVILGKMVYGGVGQNPFNPALVGRVALLISWPGIMTTWPKPEMLNSFTNFFKIHDGVTAATPLGILKEKGFTELAASTHNSLYLDLFIGNCGGCLGEVSALALILGGLYLLYKGHITWHIPLSFISSVAVIAGIFWFMDSSKYADPLFHILSGGVMIGAIFMATDMVTTPITTKGMLVFGIGCGVITMIIRLFGAYPEGVSFSILIMNALTPIIDKYTAPRRYGV